MPRMAKSHNLGSGAMIMGREHPTESMIVGSDFAPLLREPYLLLQIRMRVLNGDWEATFRTWYPGFRSHILPAVA
jgi:hypothetical protein